MHHKNKTRNVDQIMTPPKKKKKTTIVIIPSVSPEAAQLMIDSITL